MLVFVSFILWSGLIYGLTGGAKRIGRLMGIDAAPLFVRALPLLPFLFTGITGIWVLPAFAADLGLKNIANLPWWIFPIVGCGAGGLAALSYNVVNQTILGKDHRLQPTPTHDDASSVKLDAQKFREYQQSQTGRRKR